MRKRGNYLRRTTMGAVALLNRRTLAPLDDTQLRDLGLAYLGALRGMTTGHGTEVLWNTLACSINVAMVLAELGVMPQERFLEAYGTEMIGIHLHDIHGIVDHKVPLMGSFDFKRLTPFIKKEHIKVLESFMPATETELQRGVKYLRHIFADVL